MAQNIKYHFSFQMGVVLVLFNVYTFENEMQLCQIHFIQAQLITKCQSVMLPHYSD